MAEAAIAIAYPEPWNRGKALGYWLTYRLGGQILGGAINLGLNVNDSQAGKVSYTVYEVFIALQATGAFVALLLNRPQDVERRDGKKVNLSIIENPWSEIKATTTLFFSTKFLLIVFFIGQAVFSEAVYFTYLSCELAPPLPPSPFTLIQTSVWFSVRSRALGSFLSGIVAVISGNLLGVSYSSPVQPGYRLTDCPLSIGLTGTRFRLRSVPVPHSGQSSLSRAPGGSGLLS